MGLRKLIFVSAVLSGWLRAQPAFLPLSEVKSGQRGTGRTVFAGTTVSTFDVEILGVMENTGPKQSLILARLSGGPLANTGVMQGMSGSPVWVNGKLIGAVAFAFPFAKEAIGGIRPMSEILASVARGPQPRAALRFGEAQLEEIATPVAFNGFTARTLEEFGPRLREWGLSPRQAIGGGRPRAAGDPRLLEPGSMISVQLITGDMTAGADGTVTWIDGKKIYAFGHRFLSVGDTELPFARAEVLALLPSLTTSFKISAAREWMGAITSDRNTAVAGELGREAKLLPMRITVNGRQSYQVNVAPHRFLAPLMVQMAAFSALDATERSFGSATVGVRGQIEFEDGLPPVKLANRYTGDFSVLGVASLSAATPLATLLESVTPGLRLKAIELNFDVVEERRQWRIEQAWPSQRQAAPGDTLELSVGLSAENGREERKKIRYTIPTGAKPGTLYFTVGDAPTLNSFEARNLFAGGTLAGKTPAEMVALLNRQRSNSNVYIRVWRADPSYAAGPVELPGLPPSAALSMAKSSPPPPPTGSAVAELVIDCGPVVVVGSKSFELEIK
ncbi:MAG: hypothetical protein K2X03_18645 [Bryobacteraceae bacterium]|nr:hypothetical protein [Bryobacteraceae bacterium]